MELGSASSRRFDMDFVRLHQERYGKRPPEQRPLTYDIAVEDTYADWRAWLDDQLGLLDQHAADRQAGKVWLDESFWTVLFELAAGAALRNQHFNVAYERNWDGLTPDWTVMSADGRPLCFVEVHTDSPTQETYGEIRAWHGLAARIRDIPAPVILRLVSFGEPVSPPDARTAKAIVRDLRRLLTYPGSLPQMATTEQYTFQVHPATTHTSSGPVQALFDPPTTIAGVVDALRVTERIGAKVRKYARLVEAFDTPLVVAVGAHRFTGLELSHVDGLLAGQPTTTFQFGTGDSYIGQAELNLGRPNQWVMPSALAGLLWIDNHFPFRTTWRANHHADSPLTAMLLAR
jgi:hypothetical protein